jgi:hypothetical protein
MTKEVKHQVLKEVAHLCNPSIYFVHQKGEAEDLDNK